MPGNPTIFDRSLLRARRARARAGEPATFLIDREGVLRWRKTGPIEPNDATLAAALERALGAD